MDYTKKMIPNATGKSKGQVGESALYGTDL